jgi:hypothetical protein
MPFNIKSSISLLHALYFLWMDFHPCLYTYTRFLYFGSYNINYIILFYFENFKKQIVKENYWIFKNILFVKITTLPTTYGDVYIFFIFFSFICSTWNYNHPFGFFLQAPSFDYHVTCAYTILPLVVSTLINLFVKMLKILKYIYIFQRINFCEPKKEERIFWNNQIIIYFSTWNLQF